MKNKKFSLLLVLLFIFGISLLVKDQDGYLYVEDRPKGQISSKNLSVDIINSILGDQLFFRDNILNEFLVLFDKFSVGDKVVCYKREKIKLNDIYYDNSYVRLDESIIKTVSNKAYNINEISNKYPNIKTYVYNPARYLCEPILDSIWFPNNYEKYEEVFLSYLGDKTVYKKMEYSDDQISDYFYKIDRHFNVYGADKAYGDIVNMINEDFDIGQPKELLDIKIINPNYVGFYGRLNERPNYFADILSDGVYDIGSENYDYYVNGIKSSVVEEKNINNKIYDTYYRVNAGEVVFDYHDSSKLNILVITDSFIGPIKEVLSSHFNKSVMICGDGVLDTFLLDRTIKENDIDIILVMWQQQNLYYNGYYFIPIN